MREMWCYEGNVALKATACQLPISDTSGFMFYARLLTAVV